MAGVGGDVRSLVKVAQSGRKTLVLDVCPLRCARHCLQSRGVAPDLHLNLSSVGGKKRYHEGTSAAEFAQLWSDTG
jgi:uncharacterized metal-binding protein